MTICDPALYLLTNETNPTIFIKKITDIKLDNLRSATKDFDLILTTSDKEVNWIQAWRIYIPVVQMREQTVTRLSRWPFQLPSTQYVQMKMIYRLTYKIHDESMQI
jgi:hypothetical protein